MLEFVGLMNYALFKYYHDNPQIEIKEDMVFYRKMNIPIKDLKYFTYSYILMIYLKEKLYASQLLLQLLFIKMHFILIP
jgi:hypothetical protein